MAMTHALINFSLSPQGGLGGATGVEGQRDGKLREGKLYCVCYAYRVSVAACNVCVDACTCTCGCKCKCECAFLWMRIHVCVAPPIVVGVWPMAGTLWLLFEYYYYYYVTYQLQGKCAVCQPFWII